jgi:amidophosphoribosyltransferase
LDIQGICQRIGADSLAYLSLEGLSAAMNDALGKPAGHCAACFSGVYPVKIPEWLFDEDRDKLIFEETWGG